MRQIFTYIFLFFSLMLNAQINSNCDVLLTQECEECDCLIKKGDCYAQKRNYPKAIKKYNAAVACDKRLKDMIENKLIAVFELINSEKEKAEKAEEEAKRQAYITDSTATNLKAVLDALYFYEDSLALAYKKDEIGVGHYGFINKEGKLLIDFKYKEALPFSRRGYAKVKIAVEDYLIDTKGIEYRSTDDINKLNADITAFDFSWQSGFKKNIKQQKIFKNKQLKILFLDWCNIDHLPSEIGQLSNLQELHLYRNQLTELPSEIGQLSNLQKLYLWGNNFSKEEIQKIKKLLPNCDIWF